MWLSKIKTPSRGDTLLMILTEKKALEGFMTKNCKKNKKQKKKQQQKNAKKLGVEKVLKKKVVKLYIKWKDYKNR